MQTPREIIAERYELLDLIGQGGQALVFKARDLETARDVAVKIVNKSVSNDAEWVERMAREQQAMVALAGTSAVGFIDLCTSRTGALCLVMELLEGTDLEGFLVAKEKAAERLSPDEVVRMITPIVETLEKAHAVGIVHRDLKPANIFIPSNGGGARLLDFGFSRSKTSRNVTAAGTIVGSPSYIAPEMWLSKPETVDHRADVYALGVIVFRMLTGELPFKGDSLQQKFIAVTTAERPSLHELRPALSQDVDIWVERVLSIDPKDRFPSVRASFRELSWALGLSAQPHELKASDPAQSNEVRRIREWLEAPFSSIPSTFNAALKLAKGALSRLKRLAFSAPEPLPVETPKQLPEARPATEPPVVTAPPGATISEVLAWPGDASGTRPTLVLENESDHEAEMATFLAHAPTVAQESTPPPAQPPAPPPQEMRSEPPTVLPIESGAEPPTLVEPRPASDVQSEPPTRVEPHPARVAALPIARRSSLEQFGNESTVLDSVEPPPLPSSDSGPPGDEAAAETARFAQVLLRHGPKAVVARRRTQTGNPATKSPATTRRSGEFVIEVLSPDTVAAKAGGEKGSPTTSETQNATQKKGAPRRAAAKKAPAKKAPAKKTATKKAAPRKSATKKGAKKKVTSARGAGQASKRPATRGLGTKKAAQRAEKQPPETRIQPRAAKKKASKKHGSRSAGRRKTPKRSTSVRP